VLTDLAEGLAADGYDARVLTSRMRYDDPGATLSSREKRNGVDIYRLRTTRFGRGGLVGRAVDFIAFYVAAFIAVLIRVRHDDIVVTKTDPPLLGVPVGLAARVKKARLVQWLQDLFPEVAGNLGVKVGRGWSGRALALLRNRSLRRSQLCVAIGEKMRRRVESAVEGSDALVRVIPNWTDVSDLAPVSPEANLLRREWGLNDGFVVGYSGNLGRAHELDTFYAAGERLTGREADIQWLFIGGGVGYAELHKQVMDAGWANWHFKPYQPAEQLVYSLSVPDVHLICLRPEMEGLIVPSKLYGIAAVGRPAIFVGDPDGEVAQIIKAHEFGYVVETGDGQTLAEVIDELAQYPSRCAALGQNARRAAEDYFGFERSLSAWKECLDELGASARQGAVS
jgi:glycosyltransferase involved in cell wall biosynthesis